MHSPIETLFIIADISQRKNILKTLTENNIFGKVVMNGSGTANSSLGDIFGFGIIEKDVIISFVNCEESKAICFKLNSIINKTKNQGIVFTVPIDAISSDLFKLVLGGKNESNKRTTR